MQQWCSSSVLTGSYFSENIPKANAIISYNKKSVTEAVPYFEQLGPLVRQMMPIVEASPLYAMARSASDDAWKMFIGMAGSMIPERPRSPSLVLQICGSIAFCFCSVHGRDIRVQANTF
ncbi:uncharacterized protein LOC120192904 [Hibiscus syriacus]|uniref:uncharacterized protein LOC120192904 n=1 Tax=Hibiscus syriacus TaxID=106335 RepID=UPI001924735E|nr:uncharacterized protein LOC120192904 [Hibiscus syriacus]